jgi:hypothetical protein
MAINLDDWTKELEVELTMLAFDMWRRKNGSKKKALGWLVATKRRPDGA